MTMKKEDRGGMSPAEYARMKGCTLDYVYRLLVAGRLVADKRDGRWLIQEAPAGEPVPEEKAAV
jgi:hypothetical protein